MGEGYFLVKGYWGCAAGWGRIFTTGLIIMGFRRLRRGFALGARAPPPPPTWEKSSAQKCPKEERKFRPDMSAKIKTKKVGKKEEKKKRKGIKLKK